MIKMTCPWLQQKEGTAWCTAVQPNVQLDFNKPSTPDVNGSICHLPEPEIETTPPWSVCKRWKPVGVQGSESRLSTWFTHIDSRILYASVFIIIVIGVIAQLSSVIIYSYVAIFLVLLIIIVNVFVIWRRVKPSTSSKNTGL